MALPKYYQLSPIHQQGRYLCRLLLSSYPRRESDSFNVSETLLSSSFLRAAIKQKTALGADRAKKELQEVIGAFPVISLENDK